MIHKVLEWMEQVKDVTERLRVTLEAGARKEKVLEEVRKKKEALMHAKKRLEAARKIVNHEQMCSDCGEKDGEVQCVQCEDAFCEECFRLTHVRGNRAKHMKVIIGKGSLEKLADEVATKRREYEETLKEALQIKRAGYPEIECRGVWKEKGIEDVKKGGVRIISSEELEEGGGGMAIEIGRGGQSIVYEVDQMGGGGRVAVKKYVGETLGKKLKEEAECMWKLRHKNIVEVLGVCLEQGKEALVMELAEEGSLKREIYEVRREPLVRRRIEEVLEQVLCGVGFMHRQKYVHLDIKSSNVLCFGGGVVKVADFGTAREEHETGTWMTRAVEMTVRWSAPERVGGGVIKLGPGADVWSVGMVVVEMVSGKVPYWEEETLVGVVEKIRKGCPDVSGAEYEWCQEMLKRCWERDVAKRGSAEEVRAMMRRVCIVCGMEGEMRTGVECEGGETGHHYACGMCAEEEMKRLLRENGKMRSVEGGMGEVLREDAHAMHGKGLRDRMFEGDWRTGVESRMRKSKRTS